MGMLRYKTTLIIIVDPYKLYSEQEIPGQKIVTCGFGGPSMHRSRDTVHAQ